MRTETERLPDGMETPKHPPLRRPDWVERSEEDPQGGLMPAGMDILNWFRSRVDLVDVETCTLLASHEQDPFFLDFVEDGLVADVEFSPEGAPLVNLKRIGLRGEAGWTVELDIDKGDLRDTVRYAWSPWAEKPAPLGNADGDFRGRINCTCLDSVEREAGNVDWPLRVRFGAPPRRAGGEELVEPGGASGAGQLHPFARGCDRCDPRGEKAL